MNEWKTERCSEKPLELQVIAKNLYMQRRNIHEVQHEATEGVEAYTDWECECREITFEEYHNMITDDAIEQNKADIAYIAMCADIEL